MVKKKDYKNYKWLLIDNFIHIADMISVLLQTQVSKCKNKSWLTTAASKKYIKKYDLDTGIHLLCFVQFPLINRMQFKSFQKKET